MRFRHLSLVLALSLLAACADQAPPGPGTLAATLRSPNGDEGSAFVELIGQGIGEIMPLGNTEVYSHASLDGVRVVLIDQAGGELQFQVAVSDTTAKPQWVVHEVAGPDDQLRSVVVAYGLEFRR